MLVHHRDAQPVGRLDIADDGRPPRTRMLAAVGLLDARQDLHQGGLAGAVLADDRVDLPGAKETSTPASATTRS